jgi:septal ring factor EnvC (AmiA/AmiB activator)
MADHIERIDDQALDGALGPFERAEAELEETEQRRRQLAEEAARAASELESTLAESIRASVEKRDRLEEELALVIDHISRLEAMRAKSAGRRALGAETSPAASFLDLDRTADAAERDGDDGPHEERWSELTNLADDDSALTA